MDYSMDKQTLSVKETIFDGCQEQSVDLDFALPDYCPDIQRILKCQVCPKIQSKSISADKLDVDGIVVIKLLYIDAVKMAIRCCDHTEPFSMSFNLKKEAENAVAFTEIRVDYMNCRAISQRKLDIHGAFSVCAKVIEKGNQDIVLDIPSDDIQERKLRSVASKLNAIGQQQFSINEVLEIGQGKPLAESIIRTDIKAVLNDYKPIDNKVIVKGDIILKILYISNIDTGEMETMEYSVPMSQIVDVDFMTEDDVCNIKLDVLNYDVNIKSDSSGENNLFDLDMKLSVIVVSFRDEEVDLITDVYSTEYEIEPSYKNTSISKILDFINDTCTAKENIELEEQQISKIIDIWNEMISISSKNDSGELVVTGKLNICILAYDNEQNPFYIEKMLDFEYRYSLKTDKEDIIADINASLESLNYRINGSGAIEIKAQIKLSGMISVLNTYSLITDIQADEDKKRKKDNLGALTIYYADEGENLWAIARDYCTSVNRIKEENDLSDEVIQNRCMLLIPRDNK